MTEQNDPAIVGDGAVAVVDPPSTVQKIFAEVLGTFVLVFLGVGSALFILTGTPSGQPDIAAIGLAFGIAVLIMAYAVGRISGGHFNPAVTLGAAAGGRLPWKDLPLYMGAQFVGATVASALLWIIAVGARDLDFGDGLPVGANAFGEGAMAIVAAFLLELILTALFLYVILGVTDSRNEHPSLAPLAIGLSLAAIHFVAIPVTGTSVNPARSFGPALFSFDLDAVIQLWLFFLAPLLGALIAGFTYRPLFGGDEPIEGSGFGGRKKVAAVGVGSDAYQQQWNQQGWDGHQQPQHGGPDAYQQQWNQQGWDGQQQAGWDPQAQQWGQQQGGWDQQPAQYGQWGQQGQHDQQQWGQQGGWDQQAQQGGWEQQPAQQQWGQQEQSQQGWSQPQAGEQPGSQQWGTPASDEGDDDGRTQVRPNPST